MRRVAVGVFLAIIVVVSFRLATAGSDPCAGDVQKFCKGIQFGGGRLVKCLAEHEQDITPACRAEVVKMGGLLGVVEGVKSTVAPKAASVPASGGAQGPLRVKQVTTIRDKGGRVDWSAANGKIAYDSPDEKGYFQVHVMNPDGSQDQCLTCSRSGISKKHNGNPAWDPTGKYIVFESEKPQVPDTIDKQATPGAGTLNDLWIMSADGSRSWKVRDLPMRINRDAPGTLHPHFSHDGKRLLWSERVSAGGGGFGVWALHIGDIHWGSQVTMDNVQTLTPGQQPCFYESHGWSADDSRILFSGNLVPGQAGSGLDIYELTLAGSRLTRLTDSQTDWDEHAQYSPDGRYILWMSNNGLPLKLSPFQLRTEYWLMNADGSNKYQLTHFNTPGSPEYRGKPFITAGDSSWSPDGKRLLALLIDADPASSEHDRGSDVMIEFDVVP
jgi:Tol biopolymer transport system component